MAALAMVERVCTVCEVVSLSVGQEKYCSEKCASFGVSRTKKWPLSPDIGADSFAAQLRRYRDRLHLSSSQFARLVGCDPSYVARIEAGQRMPTAEYVDVMVRSLRLSPFECNGLYLAARIAPPGIRQWTSLEQAVADVQAGASPIDRAEFEATVLTLARLVLRGEGG